MKKSILRIAIVASIALLMACSNNDDDKKSVNYTGTVTFFHYVTGSSTLSLESISNDRGLDKVDFESFGPGITLTAKNWDLTVTDIRDQTDGSDDEIILDDVTFPVTYNRRSIHALIGDYDADTVELVNLTLGYDTEVFEDSDGNSDGIADDKAIYINFSNIHSELGQLDVFLVPTSQCSSLTLLGSLTPTATVDFKESTDSIRMPENITKYCLRIAEHGTNVEIYNSGERVLNDYKEQTIIIAPYTGAVDTGSQITAFYYGNGKSEKWLASNTEGRIRVFNAVTDSTDLDFKLFNSIMGSDIIDANLGLKELSSYELVDTEAVTYYVTPIDGVAGAGFFDGSSVPVNIQDGESYTVLFFGRVDSNGYSTGLKILEDDNVFSNKATFTFVNAAYVFDVVDRQPFNIHAKIPGTSLDDGSVVIPSLAYGRYNITPVNLNAPNTYEIAVTTVDNFISYADPITLKVVGGQNYLFALIEQDISGTFQIVQLAEPDAAKTLITASADTALAGGLGVEIVVQAKEGSDNSLAIGGADVSLNATGSAVISSVIDNHNGTYSATITDASAEMVTVTGTINGANIIDTEVVTFIP